jgi:hypothetical protein
VCRLVYAIILININEAFGVFLVKLSCISYKNTNCKMAKTTLNKKTKNNYSKNELKAAINSCLHCLILFVMNASSLSQVPKRFVNIAIIIRRNNFILFRF